MSNIEKMRARVLELADPNNPYSQKDFNEEFGNESFLIAESNTFKIKLDFSNKSNNPDPEYATVGSSGFDIRANLDEPIVIQPRKRAIVPTGLFFNIPENFEIQIRPRSGLAAKNGITVLNSPGTIDSDYRGEIKVILINQGDEDFTINNGDRIAQAVIASVIQKNIISLNKVSDISTETSRSDGGFGSTGIK